MIFQSKRADKSFFNVSGERFQSSQHCSIFRKYHFLALQRLYLSNIYNLLIFSLKTCRPRRPPTLPGRNLLLIARQKRTSRCWKFRFDDKCRIFLRVSFVFSCYRILCACTPMKRESSIYRIENGVPFANAFRNGMQDERDIAALTWRS